MPWFVLLVAATATIVGTWRNRRLTGLVIATVLVVLSVLSWPGKLKADQMLTSLALPVGAIWFALLATVVVLFLAGHRRSAAWVGMILLALSLAGNGHLSRTLTRSIERPYVGIDPFREGTFDAVVLLGGGVSTDRNGRSRVTAAGDRVVVAAGLYRQSQTPLVVCTGGDLRSAPNLPTVAEESATVLRELGVPDSAILQIGGVNTKTEIAAVRELTASQGWKRVGLVTSAWHLPRAMRLAREAGLEIVPLPADVRSAAVEDLPWIEHYRRFSLIPSSGALDESHAMLKELLARLVGR